MGGLFSFTILLNSRITKTLSKFDKLNIRAMKKAAYFLFLFLLSHGFIKAQCVQYCSGYTVAPITYSAFPFTGNTVTSSFSPNNDDGYTAPVPIGFNFDFYCNTYSTVLICSNGFIVFGSTAPSINGSDPAQAFPSSASPNDIVALNMNDFDPGTGGSITYTTIGTSPNQMFVVSYSDVPIWYNPATNTPSVPVYNTGQIVLYETSNYIEIHTASVGTSPYVGTQGIENAAGNSGKVVPGRSATTWSSGPSAYQFPKLMVGLPPTGITGPTVACAGDPLLFSANTSTTVSNCVWTLPPGWTGTSTTSVLNANAGSSGTIAVTANYTGCPSSTPAIIVVTVNPIPGIVVGNVFPPTVCSGNTFAVNVSGAATYTVDPGSITGTSPFTLTGVIGTQYSVTGTSAAGCINQTAVPIPITVNQTPTVTINSGSICLGKGFQLTPAGASSYSYSTPFTLVTPTAAGIVTVMVIGTTINCSDTAFSTIVTHPLPTTAAGISKTLICLKETATLTANGASSYSWQGITSTASLIVVSPTIASTYNYSVTGTNSFGCSSSATVNLTVDPCFGIGEMTEGRTLISSIYPNPASMLLNLVLTSDASVSLYDMNGKVVYTAILENGNHVINADQLDPGVYMLIARNGNITSRMRIIKHE